MALASRRPSDRRIRRSLSRLETPPLRCLDERVVIARIRGHRGWGRGDVDLYDVHAAVGSVLRRRDCEIRMQVAHATIPSATPVARDERLPPRGRVEGAIRRERVAVETRWSGATGRSSPTVWRPEPLRGLFDDDWPSVPGAGRRASAPNERRNVGDPRRRPRQPADATLKVFRSLL